MLKGVQLKRSLQKWHIRVETTKRVRNNFKVMKLDKELRLKRMVWDGILSRRKITTHLSTSMCNLEQMLLDKGRIEAF